LMLRNLGHDGAAERLESAVSLVIAEGPTTPDIGGTGGTTGVAKAIQAAL